MGHEKGSLLYFPVPWKPQALWSDGATERREGFCKLNYQEYWLQKSIQLPLWFMSFFLFFSSSRFQSDFHWKASKVHKINGKGIIIYSSNKYIRRLSLLLFPIHSSIQHQAGFILHSVSGIRFILECRLIKLYDLLFFFFFLCLYSLTII